jgi:XTP/dITP diphosphohydrolase
MSLLLATRNRDKVREIREILRDLPGLELLSALDIPSLPEVEEDADTLEGNAAKKAITLAYSTGLLTLADDTGLFVDALNGQPGVYSARYAGPDCSYADNRHKLLEKMIGKTNRRARFITVAALAGPKGLLASVRGVVEGVISENERGSNGFGYDAVFEVDGRTYAEMDDAEKNALSHRARAIQNILPQLRMLLLADSNELQK